jgi:hypothetical protein
LDVHLLKPARLDVLPGQPDVVCADDGQPAGPALLEYPYRESHPIVRWLFTKLAAWIGENFGQPPRCKVQTTAKKDAGTLSMWNECCGEYGDQRPKRKCWGSSINTYGWDSDHLDQRPAKQQRQQHVSDGPAEILWTRLNNLSLYEHDEAEEDPNPTPSP